MTAPARATVLIPTRNEEADLAGCIACVRAQDVGAAALEVIVVDGMSTDATVSLVRAAAATAGFARFSLIANPDVRTAAGLTRALGEVTTPIVVRVDARSRIPPGYVRVVCDTLDRRPEVGVVGGAQVPVDGGAGTVPSGIARALSNRYTTGLSRYRRRVGSGITDTVWMGAFRTDELRALGGWDRDHGINEDYELNQRYRDDGRLVWFEATLRSGYVPRRDLASLARQYR
ncbi:MAG: glycosyltransferase, partial [Acidimicrobiales bacterium]